MHHVRRIRPDQLPRPEDGSPLTEQFLMNHNLVPLGDDLYDCAHIDGSPEPPWGVKVVEGARSQRYYRMPEQVRVRVLGVHILRAGPHTLATQPEKVLEHLNKRLFRGRPSRIKEMIVKKGDVQETDLIVDREVLPNRWRGERR